MLGLRPAVLHLLRDAAPALGLRHVEPYAGHAQKDNLMAAVCPGALVLPVGWTVGGEQPATLDVLACAQSPARSKSVALDDAVELADRVAAHIIGSPVLTFGGRDFELDVDHGARCSVVTAESQFGIVQVRTIWTLEAG